jgi:hypothetical protein
MSSSRRRPWKLLVPAAVAAVLFTLIPLSSVAAAAPPPAQDTHTFCQNVPSNNPFTDVGPGAHHDNILCLSFAGITQGTTATTYSPTNTVTRGQMASFIARSIDKANSLVTPGTTLTTLPPDDGTNSYSDVSASNVHKASINRLSKAGIVQGLSNQQCLTLAAVPPCFGPDQPVTRGQMASFINSAEKFLTGTEFTSSTDFFTDDNGSTHEANINGIASVGIATGLSDNTYAPNDGVTRQQMASFIIRWLAVEQAAGDIKPLPGNGASLTAATATDADHNGTLSNGDSIVLTFANPVAATSSITLKDADNTVATLTDTTPLPSGDTPATFTLSNGNKTLTITLTGPLVASGGDNVLKGTITITGASGITDASSGTAWDPTKEPPANVNIAFPAAQGQTGTVTFVDLPTKTYRFVADGASSETTVTYKAGDTFKDDGVSATLAKFESDLSVGDTIHFIDDTSASNVDTHELTNHSMAGVNSGVVGNVNTAAHTFVIIEPVSGAPISDVKNYNAQLYSIDGTSAVQSTFEAAINEGDTIVITVPTTGATTYALTNKTVSGKVSTVNTATHVVQIGALGDDPTGPQDANYLYTLATSTYTVDGTTATLAQFEAQINVGDLLTYARDAGVQTLALTNQAPPVQTGTVTETHSAGTTSITVVNGANRFVINYAGTPVFKLNGVSATQTELEAHITAGDTVSFTPDNNATPANEQQLNLTDATPDKSVTGVMKDIQVGPNTYDVDNSSGGIIYDNLQYVAPPPSDFGGFAPRYFVKAPSGTESEVTLAQWEGYLNKIAAATNPVANIMVVGTSTAVEHHLTTDQTIP